MEILASLEEIRLRVSICLRHNLRRNEGEPSLVNAVILRSLRILNLDFFREILDLRIYFEV
jgi:hypothetical protein